jgi:cell division protein ZapA (FtsZ GTPase activity inhibitor)
VKQSVTVRLGGHSLSLRTEDDPDYIRSVAAYLSEQMAEIKGAAESMSAHQIALLAGIQVVDKLFQLQKANLRIENKVQARVDRALSLLDEYEPT